MVSAYSVGNLFMISNAVLPSRRIEVEIFLNISLMFSVILSLFSPPPAPSPTEEKYNPEKAHRSL